MKEGWINDKLSNCFKLKSGDYLSSKTMENGEFPVYGGNGIIRMHNNFNLLGKNIIIGRVGALCGNARYIDYPIWATDNAFIITDYKYEFDYRFLTHQLNQLNLRQYARQAAQPVISNSSLKDVFIKIPPVTEQQRIVEILDVAFAKIDAVKQNTERNLQNAKELFQSVLDFELSPKEKWEEKKLSEVFNINPKKSEVRNILDDNDYVSFLPMEDLGICRKITKPNKEKLLKDVYSGYTYFAENDVLLAKVTPCFENGKLGIAKNLINNIGFGSSEYIVFRSLGYVLPEFLFYFLSKDSFRTIGANLMFGTSGLKRISKQYIEETIITYPHSISEQHQIVSKLDALSAKCKELKNNYLQTINDCDELKKAILAKAFNGEL